MEAISLDVRLRVIEACEAGELTRAEIAELYRVSQAWLYNVLKRYRETGSLAPIQQSRRGREPIFDDKLLKRLQSAIERQPDATLAELRDKLSLKCALSTICLAVKKLSLTYKKDDPSLRATAG